MENVRFLVYLHVAEWLVACAGHKNFAVLINWRFRNWLLSKNQSHIVSINLASDAISILHWNCIPSSPVQMPRWVERVIYLSNLYRDKSSLN